MEKVIGLLKDDGEALQLKKGAFFTKEIDYSAHSTRTGRLKVANHNVGIIHELKTPTTVGEL